MTDFGAKMPSPQLLNRFDKPMLDNQGVRFRDVAFGVRLSMKDGFGFYWTCEGGTISNPKSAIQYSKSKGCMLMLVEATEGVIQIVEYRVSRIQHRSFDSKHFAYNYLAGMTEFIQC